MSLTNPGLGLMRGIRTWINLREEIAGLVLGDLKKERGDYNEIRTGKYTETISVNGCNYIKATHSIQIRLS